MSSTALDCVGNIPPPQSRQTNLVRVASKQWHRNHHLEHLYDGKRTPIGNVSKAIPIYLIIWFGSMWKTHVPFPGATLTMARLPRQPAEYPLPNPAYPLNNPPYLPPQIPQVPQIPQNISPPIDPVSLPPVSATMDVDNTTSVPLAALTADPEPNSWSATPAPAARRVVTRAARPTPVMVPAATPGPAMGPAAAAAPGPFMMPVAAPGAVMGPVAGPRRAVAPGMCPDCGYPMSACCRGKRKKKDKPKKPRYRGPPGGKGQHNMGVVEPGKPKKVAPKVEKVRRDFPWLPPPPPDDGSHELMI